MLNLSYQPFIDFIKKSTSFKSRERYLDSVIAKIEVFEDEINAEVVGTKSYTVNIKYDDKKVSKATCTCPYDQIGKCKHIIHAIVEADRIILQNGQQSSTNFVISKGEKPLTNQLEKTKDGFILPNTHILSLSSSQIKNISHPIKKYRWSQPYLGEGELRANQITINVHDGYSENEVVTVIQEEKNLRLSCTCSNTSNKLCNSIHFLLQEVIKEPLFELPFNQVKRHEIYTKNAIDSGLDTSEIDDLDGLFFIKHKHGRLQIHTTINIISFNEHKRKLLKDKLIQPFQFPTVAKASDKKEFVVVANHEYSNTLVFMLHKAPLTKSGEIKSPFYDVEIALKLKHLSSPEEINFYAAILASHNGKQKPEDYAAIFKNPSNLGFYFLETKHYTNKITPKNITPLTISSANTKAAIYIKESNNGFYVLTCSLSLDNKKYTSKNINLIHCFALVKDHLFLINNEVIINTLSFFKNEKHEIFLHKSQFKSFKEDILDALENDFTIHYEFIKPAPAKVIKEKSLNKISKHTIYLSDSEDYITITPVMTYGDIEVPILSKKTIYTENPDGSLYSIERDEKAELRYLRSIQSSHPAFEDIPAMHFFYLHKQEFLENGWFIDAFEDWRNLGYDILGFNTLKNNRYNQNKMKVNTRVESGIDWFDVHASVSFGEQNVSLKEIQKSVVNKSRFVQLGDGTQGIMPTEWLDKFGNYFRSGEIKDGTIRTHKTNFQLIDELFDKEVLSSEVKMEIENYKEKLNNFHSIRSVEVPKKLKATLRDYQKEGLNWLNFLHEFGFGGCLADDMGLGKTIQVIAYFLSQHEKGIKETNLVVVPTSLLFNWQKELDKFAPHLKYLALYGTNRDSKNVNFKKFDIIITTYGTLLSDIELLSKNVFNIIVLDESQAIKNTESKRYKAVRLLQGRQRIVVTGTPVENSTFDLYAQLSFASPGLLGSAKRFATDYSTPIDKYQDTARASELQKKVHPFILRRTKKQVATELPEKTEMVIYCEMGKEQKRIYDGYKKEFQNYLSGMNDDELHSSSLHILQGLTKLRQICNSPALLSDEEFYGDESAKLDELLEQINTLKGEHKILIFSQFVGMLDLLKARLEKEKTPFAYLTGQTKNREEQVELFQNDESIRVFLISLKAGGTGLNLTKAEYVFIVDPWWNPAVENQAIDRAYRIGQQNKVVAVRLITPDTIEEKIMELQQRKKQLVEDLIHTDTNVLKKLSKNDLMDIV